MNTTKASVVLLVTVVSLLGPMTQAQTAFTFRPTKLGLDGFYDLRFRLYNAPLGGVQVGLDYVLPDTTLVKGWLEQRFDFGTDVFDGQVRWLEVASRSGELDDPAPYAPLSPRQMILLTDAFIAADQIRVSGNVGMGVEPTCKLDIAGGVRIFLPPTGETSFGIADGDGHLALGVFSDGRTGLGTMIPAYRLDVSGDIGCVALHQASDERFKTNVADLTNVLDKIERIRGVSFEWNGKAECMGAKVGQRQIGVIAQDVESVFPEIVVSSTAGYKAVDYTRLTAVLVEAIKELKAENESLKSRLRALEVSISND